VLVVGGTKRVGRCDGLTRQFGKGFSGRKWFGGIEDGGVCIYNLDLYLAC